MRNRLSETRSGWQKRPEPVYAWPIDARQPMMSNYCWNGTEQEAEVVSYPGDCHSIL